MLGFVAHGLVTAILAWRYRPPRRDPAFRLYRRFIRRTGVEPARGEPPLAFLERLSQERPALAPQAAEVTRLYLETRYGGTSGAGIERLRNAVGRSLGTAAP